MRREMGVTMNQLGVALQGNKERLNCWGGGIQGK